MGGGMRRRGICRGEQRKTPTAHRRWGPGSQCTHGNHKGCRPNRRRRLIQAALLSIVTRSCELLPGDGVLQGVQPCRYSILGIGG